MVSQTHAYIFDANMGTMASIENIQLQKNEKAFVSCTCSDTTFYIASSDKERKSYLNHYSLPDFKFMRQLDLLDVIKHERRRSPRLSFGRQHGQPAEPVEYESGLIHAVRYNQERLGLTTSSESGWFFHTVRLTHEPFEVAQILLPMKPAVLIVLVSTTEWLIFFNDYDDTSLQISADCKFKTKLEKTFGYSRHRIRSGIMFGLFCLALFNEDSLDLYKV